MKKKYALKLLTLFICLFLKASLYSQGFKHPGLLHTNEDFIRIKAQLAANDPAVVAGYNNLVANEWSQSNVNTYPVEIIKRGIAGDENYINAARGAHAAYMNALRWKISGDAAHAERAIYILNSWANVTTAIGGNSNMSLASGLYGYEFANAAELMRDYSGWVPADFKKFQDWMQYVWYPYVYDFLYRRHDTWSRGTPGHYWSNWGLCNTLAMISIGVLCDDEFIYNQGIAFYKYDKIGTFKDASSLSSVDNWGLTEFIGNLVPVVHEDNRGALGYLGQMQESGRDQGHANMALGLAVDICQIAWNQGDDLFGYMDNRLLAGLEFVAAYNSGTNNLPWTNYWYHDVNTPLQNSWIQTANNSDARGQFRPIWDRIIGHYEGQKGITLNFAHNMADMVVADGGGGGGVSTGYDHLGYSTLTCTRPVINPANAPLTLSASILYDGQTYQQGELINVTPGSTVKLIPLLPQTVTDNGNWLWDNASTSKDLQITANNSGVYRVRYINDNGAESYQLFSIAVYGDCKPDRYYYSITTDDGVVNSNEVTVPMNSEVKISIWSSSGKSIFLWNSGGTSGTKNVVVGNSDIVESVTGTNLGGAEVTIDFHINVEPLGYSYKIGEGSVINDRNVIVNAGKTVTLIPIVKTGLEGGTWLWDSGETTQNLVLDNVQEDSEVSVTYTYNGSEYKQTYFIKVVSNETSFCYWPMDEGTGNIAYDVWSGKDGNRNSSAWSDMGAKQGSVTFDGGNASYINLKNNFLSSLNDFTVSVWVKPDVLETWARVWDFGNGMDNYMFLTDKANDGYVRFGIREAGIDQQITTTKVLAINKWTHIAVTKSGNTAKLYINGVESGSNTNMTINPSDLGYTNQNYIGKSQWPDPMFKGTIDELKIYKGSMSQAEINEVMQAVEPYQLSYSLDGGAVVKYNIVSAVAGQDLELIPYLKPGMETMAGLDNITWLWSNGKTSQNITLLNIQDSQNVSLKYSYAGVEYTVSFSIIVKPSNVALYYWPMNETSGTIANDVWNGKNGNINSASWTANGKVEGAVQLDGSASSYVSLPSNFISGLNDFTISAWVNPSELSTWARIWDFGVDTNYNMFLTPKASDGFVRFTIKNGGVQQSIITTSTMPTNEWTYVTVTKSGNTAKIYLNGDLVGTNTALTLKPSDLGNTTQNYVGKSQWPDSMFKGKIDELVILNSAIDQDKIKNIMILGVNEVLSQKVVISETAISVYVETPSCPGKSDGKIKVATNLNGYTYTIVVKGGSVNQIFNNVTITPTTEWEMSNLTAGSYQVTVSIASISFEQSYGVLVNEINAITAKRVKSEKTVSYVVSGSNEYTVTVNGVTKRYITANSETSEIDIDSDLLQATNKIVIVTDNDCQGIIEDSFTMSPSVTIHPNPTSDIVYIEGVIEGSVEVYNNNGALLMQKNKINENSIDLKGYPTGIYFIKIKQGEDVETFKVILK